MKEYPKIQSIFRRDPDNHFRTFLEGEWATPEFEYLQNTLWDCTEKIDGTNIRVLWDGEKIEFRGKTDRAQIPPFLLEKLNELFTCEKMWELFPKMRLCLYGEGYGAKIQKGGDNYIPDGVDFMLFDVLVNNFWLMRKDVENVADSLKINVVKSVYAGTLNEIVEFIKTKSLMSVYGKGDFLAEGLVMRPKVELRDRAGNRIVTKIKHKDFD